jgi:tripartite-type tricarboxylate transporter receptor subunit TctC
VQPGFDIDIWLGVAAPSAVSHEVVKRAGEALRDASAHPGFQLRMSTLGFDVDFRSGDKFRELIVSDHHKYGLAIREAGIKPD